MKLLPTIHKRYLFYSVVLFIAAGIIVFIGLTGYFKKELSEQLRRRQEQFISYYAKSGADSLRSDPVFTITRAKAAFSPYESDTLMFNGRENEREAYRILTFPVLHKSQWYEIRTMQALYESEDLLMTIVAVLLGILIVQLFVLQLLNRQFTRKLFEPFIHTLQMMQDYRLNVNGKPNLVASKIEEFQNLNTSFLLMHDRILADYNHLQEFTANASHELQTPLAVMQSKVELLEQSNNLSEQQVQLIQDIRTTVHRLTRMNQSLLLLAKIDNNFFVKNESVRLDFFLAGQMEEVQEIIQIKKIELAESLQKTEVQMNPTLAEIMISNLLMNAIRHNYEGGRIDIQSGTRHLQISNTGPETKLDADRIFQRFYKDTAAAESTGLGLAIIKQICHRYGFKIAYRFLNNLHIFDITL